jgi:hypothetical protein
MKTPARMTDLRHVDSGLPAMERHELILAARRRQQIAELQEKYSCHPSNAPARGTYHPTTGARLQ